MILIIGAQTSGKRSYVETLGYSRDQMADASIDERPVVFNVQEFARRDDFDCDELIGILIKKDVVICNEVGSGVVPANELETRFRETAGRFSTRLAERAERVVRLVCGIPIVLKG